MSIRGKATRVWSWHLVTT